MNDIDLARAQVIWDREPPEGEPALKVVTTGKDDDSRYGASWGACNGDFNDASDERKLAMLFVQYHYLTAVEGIPAAEVHDAFMPIVEYRRALVDFGSLDPAKANLPNEQDN